MGSLKKNFLYNIAYQVLQVLLPLVTAPYISRTLGASALGVYTYTNSVAYYFLLAAALGLANHGNRSVAAARGDQQTLNKVFSGIFSLQFVTFSVSLACYGLYLAWFVRENRLIAALQTLYLLSGLLDISWLYFGLEKFKLTVSRNVAVKLATVAAIFLFVHTPEDLWKYTLIMTLGTLLSQVCLWWYLKGNARFVRVGLKEVLSHLKPALILFVPVLAYSIYKVMDKIMLGNMTDYAAVGFYNNAEKIINIPMGIITALGTVMLPRMANHIAHGDSAQTESYIRVSLKFVTVFTSAVGFGLLGVSRVIAPVFFGPGYEPCGPLIALMALSVFFVAWANVIRTQYLIPNHDEKVYLLSTTVGAALNLAVNLALIPNLGAVGAAIGTVTAEMTVLVIQAAAVRKRLPVHRYIGQYAPVLLLGGVMALLVWFLGMILPTTVTTLILQIACGGLFFCLGLLAWLKWKQDELWHLLMDTIGNKFRFIGGKK